MENGYLILLSYDSHTQIVEIQHEDISVVGLHVVKRGKTRSKSWNLLSLPRSTEIFFGITL